MNRPISATPTLLETQTDIQCHSAPGEGDFAVPIIQADLYRVGLVAGLVGEGQREQPVADGGGHVGLTGEDLKSRCHGQ